MQGKWFLERVESASFGPEALKAIGRAFDEAWADIAGNFGEPEAIEFARLKLADAILAVAATTAKTLRC